MQQWAGHQGKDWWCLIRNIVPKACIACVSGSRRNSYDTGKAQIAELAISQNESEAASKDCNHINCWHRC